MLVPTLRLEDTDYLLVAFRLNHRSPNLELTLKSIQYNSTSNGCFAHPAVSLNGSSDWGWASQVLEKSLPLCQSIALFVQLRSSKETSLAGELPCFAIRRFTDFF